MNNKFLEDPIIQQIIQEIGSKVQRIIPGAYDKANQKLL
jgi:hypothetical protein